MRKGRNARLKKGPSYWWQPRRRSVNLGRIWGSIWNIIKRLLVLVALLAAATIAVVAVCRFVAGEIRVTVLAVYLAVSLIVVGWSLNSVSKRRLSFSRTFMVILIAVILSILSSVYLDIRSFKNVRDSVVEALSTQSEQFRSSVDLLIQRAELKFIEASSALVQEIEEQGNTSPVYSNGAVLVGADGHVIALRNNPSAKNPSWAELKAFLLEDDTDGIEYVMGKFVCADFAERLHNNAEAAGIRAAYVLVDLGPCSYYPRGSGHALNAFETTDRGLVYIDCTGVQSGVKLNADKIVDLEVGKDYVPRSIFPEPGWPHFWLSMGKVERMAMQW